MYEKYFLFDNKYIGDMKHILKTIQQVTEAQCKPYMNKRSIFKFKENVSASRLYEMLKSFYYQNRNSQIEEDFVQNLPTPKIYIE